MAFLALAVSLALAQVAGAAIDAGSLACSFEIDGKPAAVNQSNQPIRVERSVEQHDGQVVVRARIVNDSDRAVTLGLMKLLETQQSWEVARAHITPGVVYAADSTLVCEPLGKASEREIRATQVLAAADPGKPGCLVAGYLNAGAARPEIVVTLCGGGVRKIVAQERMLARVLGPKQTLELDAVYLSTKRADAWEALIEYANRAGAAAQHERRLGPTALWCSWYAHRMEVSEDLVLANAAVAAKHFGPLGFAIMQIDHGWQKGNITGDWRANERFPHGLKWLSEELKKRHGLALGLWIAPTDVAETSETFKQHSEWLLRGADGKPAVNWRWYWKPNPNCYELDASVPEARKWLESVLRNLSTQGVSYFKIDFIASSGSEGFVHQNPAVTRGWGVLREAMEAIRAGAGEDAWIRYCQTPPLLSAGLASSAYGGDDTYDAGVPQSIGSLRGNARSLAAGFWINDRLYHREVCDMSVRMQADVEEVRLRLAIMALAGCSISFSDELCHLPMSRIRMMQQCLPPGAPQMRPLDLFEREIPSLWHLHCEHQDEAWEVVGLFNWEDSPQERAVDLPRIGLSGDVLAYEFWEQRFLGVQREKLTMTLPPRTSRIVALRRVAPHPQVLGQTCICWRAFMS
jgi:alpha-galactosidase